jgi:Ca-activated chloride channel family protein
MKTRIQKKISSRKAQIVLFGILAAMTLLLVGLQVPLAQRVPGNIQDPHTPPRLTEVIVDAELSQAKLIQGQDGIVYVNLSIQTPSGSERPVGETPTDMVVVLDRSPSMLAANKLPFAKAAVRELIKKLTASDRLGLIAFDGRASVVSELVDVTPAARKELTRMVNNLRVGSATNIGDGLVRARELIEQSPSHRIRKIIVLSDGETNTGITNPHALAKIASDISAKNMVVSTIGMGLGFNEALMASLADHGMGNYSYLEHLHTLGSILAKDLEDVRLMYAESSELQLQLNTGVKLVDASGYPIETVGENSSHVRIKTGQLLWGASKNLMLTLQVPTARTGDFALGDMAFHFNTNGTEQQATVKHEQLALAVVEASKKPEAVASIKSEVYRKSWLSNNLGRMRQQFYRRIKEGNKSKAQEAIDNYRRELRDAEAQSGLPIKDDKLEEDIGQMEAGLEDAFRGTPAEQAVKRNRFSKSMQYLGRAEQRQ